MRLLCLLLLGAVAGCAADPPAAEGDATEVSGNQPVCLEARARVAAHCKDAELPSFEDDCAEVDRCRAGCIYDHPCSATKQAECIAAKC
ncbi:MAG: hypothetical protein KF819_21450 [Labilithrix sp.]|nr:hypothetical protein [Labilithrix sp.]